VRIAANDVERALAIANEEARFEGAERRDVRRDEVVEAMNRAAELRRRPFGTAVVRGRKDGIPRTVITTGEVNGMYRRCLIPYNDAQRDGQRRTKAVYFYRRGDKGRWLKKPPIRSSKKEREEDLLDVRALLPVYFHDCFILESRLER
jgi:hypothetical protein